MVIPVRIIRRNKSIETDTNDSRALASLSSYKKSRPNVYNPLGATTVYLFADCDNVGLYQIDMKEADILDMGVGESFLSASGKYKRVISLDNPNGIKITRRIAEANLKHYLPELMAREDFGIDKQGMLTSFIDSKALVKIEKASENKLPLIVPDYNWSFRPLSLTQQASVIQPVIGVSPRVVHAFLTRLACTSRLLTTFDLPCTFWSKQLGTNPGVVCKLRDTLEAQGLLVATSKTYCAGRKSFSYRAAGALKDILKKNIKKLSLPESFIEPKAGEWHAFVWNMSRFFVSDYDEFLAWLSQFPGFNLKRRRDKALYAIRFRQLSLT